jgi:hypothetical protein
MLAGYWLFSIPILVQYLKRVSNALILEVNELLWCQFASLNNTSHYQFAWLLCLEVCKYPPIMHKGCSLEYPTQEPPTPTHYAKGNVSLVITSGTAKMHPTPAHHAKGNMSLVITNGTGRMHLMPTHYAKGNMSLVITNGTARMHLMSTHYAKGNMSLVITKGTARMHLTWTHYAKGNMSLVITNGTAKMQPITHGHTQGWLLHET